MGEAGRLTKRTPETDEQVTRLLMDGCTRRDTAAAIGIHEDTFRAWMIAHPDFAALVKKAEGACLREAAGIIQRVARGGIVVKETTTTVTNRDGSSTTRSEREVTRPEWTAAAWLLERR